MWRTANFHAIGASSSKRKDNDAAFHWPVLKKILSFVIDWAVKEVNKTEEKFVPPQDANMTDEALKKWKKEVVLPKIIFFLYTDGCMGQYYGCKAFWFFSQVSKIFSISIHHIVCVANKFKGPHDSFGHVFKKWMHNMLLKAADSKAVDGVKTVNKPPEYFMFAFDNIVQPSPTKNMRYYHKFTVDEVHVLYVAYAKKEYDDLCSVFGGKYKN